MHNNKIEHKRYIGLYQNWNKTYIYQRHLH